MSLTSQDFLQIKAIVTDVVHDALQDAVPGIVTGIVNDATKDLVTKTEFQQGMQDLRQGLRQEFHQDMDRMEARILTGMGLVERDAFDRLDEHERRITRLERASA